MRLRSPYDREILRLALPALGALAAGPLYTLVDTAIVGHLGVRQLAGLALAGTLLTAVVEVADFLSYGTTAQVARLHGAGDTDQVGEVVAQAVWLSLMVGLLSLVVVLVLGGPLLSVLGHGAGVHAQAEHYMLIVAFAIPAQLLALAGEGCLRGLGDLRSPLRILVIANLANVVLEVVFVYGLGLGLTGSAIGTLLAVLGMGVAFARRLLAVPGVRRRPNFARMRPLLRTGGHITVRTVSLLGAFTLASALAAHLGAADLAAHQIAFQLFLFIALVLDAIAIAGQILVARLLGSSDAGGAWAAALRMVGWSLLGGLLIGAVLLALAGVGPRLFSGSAPVLRLSHPVWRLLALMQPLAAIVFALDGILIGAGDTRYLAAAMALSLVVFVPLALLGGSLTALWWALNALIVVRLVTLVPRFARRRWAVVGARAG
jgi:putative MATE family efflux protein